MMDKDYFYGITEDLERFERCYWRRVGLVFALAAILAVILTPLMAQAEARFQVQDKDITITLYDEPCELTEHVSNLPYKAVWKEGAKTFQGCYGARPDYEAVVAYFDDKTFALIPFSVVKKVTNI